MVLMNNKNNKSYIISKDILDEETVKALEEGIRLLIDTNTKRYKTMEELRKVLEE